MPQIFINRKAVLTPPLSAYHSLILSDSPVGYWRLGETSGTIAVDQIGAAHNGTYIGAPLLGVPGLIAGDANTAVTFGPDARYMTVPNTTTIRLNSNFSLEVWFKTTASTQNVNLIGSFESLFNTGHGIFMTNSTLRVGFDGGANATGSLPQIHDGNRHHVVATYTGNAPNIQPRIYLDGTLVFIDTANKTITDNNTIFIAANANLSGFFDGTIDEAAIYNGVLTPTQVLNHYNAGI